MQKSQQKESSVLQHICSLTKPNVIEKYALPIQNNQYKPAFQQRRKYVWCIFIWLPVANRRINHSFISFPKYRSGFVQTCTYYQQDVEFRECCDWMYHIFLIIMYPGKLWQLSLSWPIQSDHLLIVDQMIPTQCIPGKQVLVKSVDR